MIDMFGIEVYHKGFKNQTVGARTLAIRSFLGLVFYLIFTLAIFSKVSAKSGLKTQSLLTFYYIKKF